MKKIKSMTSHQYGRKEKIGGKNENKWSDEVKCAGHIHTHTHMHIYIHIYTFIHMHTHAYTHAHTHLCTHTTVVTYVPFGRDIVRLDRSHPPRSRPEDMTWYKKRWHYVSQIWGMITVGYDYIKFDKITEERRDIISNDQDRHTDSKSVTPSFNSIPLLFSLNHHFHFIIFSPVLV